VISALQIRMGIVLLVLALITVGFGAVVGFLLNSLLVGIGLVMIFVGIQFIFGKKIALKTLSSSTVEPDEYPELHGVVRKVSQQADIPKPDVGVTETPVKNAFAVGFGRENATVTVTTGLLEELDTEELEAVVAHEIAHIKNRDAMVMTGAGAIVVLSGFLIRNIYFLPTDSKEGIGAFLAFFLAGIVTYILSFLSIRALSRYREYSADRAASTITGDPMALAQALRKISETNAQLPREDLRDVSSHNALMFDGVDTTVSRFLRTHPPSEERIERLEEIQKEQFE
jgi:heat shock protein HtpX